MRGREKLQARLPRPPDQNTELTSTLIAAGIEQIADTVAAGADAEKELKEAATKTLAEAKDELKQTLADRDEDLLIVVDDIDRLTAEEIRLLFRLIKANVDFPRFIYLLLFDQEVVVKALNKLSEDRGQAFLEKIVQVSFDIPVPAWGDLAQLMHEEMLSTLAGSRDASSHWDETRWERMIDQLRPYLANVRAVRRLMNAFRFSFSLFVHRRAFDANPEDLFGLEAIRLFEPALYARLFHNKRLLVKGERDYERIFAERRGDDEGARTVAKEKFLTAVVEDRRDGIASLLREIFPNSRWELSGTDSAQLLKGRRAAHPDYFERYFRLVVSEESLRRSELLAVFAAAADRNKLVQTLRSYVQRDRLHLLLTELTAHIEELHPHLPEVLAAFFNFGDDLPERSWTYLGSEMEREIANLLLTCLLNIPDQQSRADMLMASIRQSHGLSIPFHVVAMECSERHRTQIGEESLVVPNRLVPELKKVIADKIAELQDSIVRKPTEGSLGVLLYFWKEWDSVDAPASWLRANIDMNDIAWRFVSAATSSSGQMQGVRISDVDLSWLVQFMPLERIDQIVDRLKTRTEPAAVQQLVDVYPSVRARFVSNDEKPLET